MCAKHTMASGEQTGGSSGVLAAGFDAVVNERANQLALAQGPDALQPRDHARAPALPCDPVCTLELDGVRMDTEAMLVAVGNGPAYGGGMRVTPDASEFDDGLLDVLVLHKISTGEFLRVFPTVFKGTHVSHHAKVQVLQGPHGVAGGHRHRVVRRRGAVRAAADDHGGRARRAHRSGRER
jgi:diacylglycerol kinase (ATP)